MPVRVAWGGKDKLCTREKNQQFIDDISSLKKEIEFPDADHYYFTSTNDAVYKKALSNLLPNFGKDIKGHVCDRPVKF